MLRGLPELGMLLQVERELPHLIRKVYGERGPMFRADLGHGVMDDAMVEAAAYCLIRQ